MRKALFNFLLLFAALLSGCEENLTLDIPEGEALLVVEGHIEQDAPPIVILTRSVPVLSSFSDAALTKSFVHHAQVTVTTAGRSYVLEELSAAAFTPALRGLVAEQFSVPLARLEPTGGFIFYVYTSEELKGEVGQSYQLRISHEGSLLTASTTVPQLNPLEALWTVPHPDPQQDSLVTLMYRYQDPDTVGNSIRYFTKRNQEPFYPGLFSSVFNDELINGGNISFPLDRGEPKGQQDVDLNTYSYFSRGDTITVRWCAIDLPHYRFWYTLESEQNNNGSPVGTPTITQSNIKGGLGIWGGYGVTYHKLVVE